MTEGYFYTGLRPGSPPAKPGLSKLESGQPRSLACILPKLPLGCVCVQCNAAPLRIAGGWKVRQEAVQCCGLFFGGAEKKSEAFCQELSDSRMERTIFVWMEVLSELHSQRTESPSRPHA